IALLQVLHDHGRLRQAERALLEHRDLPHRVLLVQPRGAGGQVDHDRLVRDAFFGEQDPHPGAVRAPVGVVEREAHETDPTPSTSASCASSSSGAGRSAGDEAVRATARTRPGSAPVSRATTLGFAARATTSPGGSAPKCSGSEAYSSAT